MYIVISFRHGITRENTDKFKEIRKNPRHPCLKETFSSIFFIFIKAIIFGDFADISYIRYVK